MLLQPNNLSWLAAIKAGFFATWPRLTDELVKDYLPKSDAMGKGHLSQQYKNTQSTKQSPSEPSATPPQNQEGNNKAN
jgi:hypothetical protein